MTTILDELREHGREVIAKVRLRQQHDAAVKRPADLCWFDADKNKDFCDDRANQFR